MVAEAGDDGPDLARTLQAFMQIRAPGTHVPENPGAYFAKVPPGEIASRLLEFCSAALPGSSNSTGRRGATPSRFVALAGLAVLRVPALGSVEPKRELKATLDGLLAVICLEDMARREKDQLEAGTLQVLAAAFRMTLKSTLLRFSCDSARAPEIRRLYFGAGILVMLDWSDVSSVVECWARTGLAGCQDELEPVVQGLGSGGLSPEVDGPEIAEAMRKALHLGTKQPRRAADRSLAGDRKMLQEEKISAACTFRRKGRAVTDIAKELKIARSTLYKDSRFQKANAEYEGARQDQKKRLRRQ